MSKRKAGRGFRRAAWFVGDVAKRAAHDGLSPLTRTWREGEPVMRQRVLMVPRMGDSPGGLGPTPKGKANPPTVYDVEHPPVIKPWANAEHKRERARNLRRQA